MAGEGSGGVPGRDLVVLALPGVQRFIGEARSTSDVRAASEIYVRLAAEAARACGQAGGELVFPPAGAGLDGMPNRVVALFPAGAGGGAARAAGDLVRSAWRAWVGQALRLGTGAAPPETPGFPVVQWACVPAGAGGYAGQWREAQRLLAARRRVRDFAAVEWPDRALCGLGPRWPAENVPAGLREHERDTLSAAGWVKRRWRRMHGLAGFPSTASIASVPFRRAVLERMGDREVSEAVSDLVRAARAVSIAVQGGDVREARVPGLADPGTEPGAWFSSTGGPWVYPDRWQADSLAREGKAAAGEVAAAVADGLRACRRLRAVMGERGVPVPSAYLAVLAADLDGMGRFLAGQGQDAAGGRAGVSAAAHQEVSVRLQELAGVQRQMLEGGGLLGVPIYAGGDDLLAFAPAVTALDAAQACHDAVPPSLPTVSTAVVFFHYHASLQAALSSTRRLLDQAKERVPGKNGLAVGYLRRSGVSEASIQPWTGRDGGSAPGFFGVFAAGREQPLSPRLVADLDRDADELAALSVSAPAVFRAELARLVRRHTGDGAGSGADSAAEAAAALEWLGNNEAAGRKVQGSPGSWPQLAARVGVFLRQEAR